MQPFMEIYTAGFQVKLGQVQKLLAEAYEHYFANGGDHCKSSEGAVSVRLPPYFWQDGQPNYGAQQRPGIEIYSYVLGPSRLHYFDDIDQALAAVQEWHAAEMAHRHDQDMW